MKFISFLFIVLVVYAIYYVVMILLDMAGSRKLSAVNATANKNFISTADLMEEAEAPVVVVQPAKAIVENKESALEALPDEATGMEVETITYGMEISAENVAGLFV